MTDARQRFMLRFMLALAIAVVFMMTYFLAWTVGVTPASTEEREFIEMARRSALASSPRVSAALQVSDEAAYVSRQHFQAIADAITN